MVIVSTLAAHVMALRIVRMEPMRKTVPYVSILTHLKYVSGKY